jgi:hypothetical protein
MRIKLFLLIFIPVIFQSSGFSQQLNEYELSQDEWEVLKDEYAVRIIILMSHLDSLNSKIDSMKLQLEEKQTTLESCNSDLYALLGTNEAGIADFRIKFSEMEKRFRSNEFSPDGVKSDFYSEIASSKIRCLPEFSDRYISMLKKMEIPVEIKTPEGIYLVAKGDCLWSISKEKLGNPALWPAIWNVNKEGVYNKNIMPYYSQQIINPDLIYPGQELRIPALSDTDRLMKENLKSLRKRRKTQ